MRLDHRSHIRHHLANEFRQVFCMSGGRDHPCPPLTERHGAVGGRGVDRQHTHRGPLGRFPVMVTRRPDAVGSMSISSRRCRDPQRDPAPLDAHHRSVVIEVEVLELPRYRAGRRRRG